MNLVTGATGIIGSHVVLALLRDGQEVKACKQKNSDIKKVKDLFLFYSEENKPLFEKIIWIDLDITDFFSVEDALEGIATVYHCAGLVSFNRKDRKKLFKINEKGTKNMVDACLHKKINAFCHVSSLGTINNLDHRLPLDETVFWKKSGKESDYAISKYNAEKEVWRGMEEGLNAVIINPGVVMAPGFWGQSSMRIFDTCYKGNRFYTAGTTGYVAAIDVAAIMLQLVAKNKFGKRYILIENNYSFKTIFDLIQTNFNKAKPNIKVSRAILNAGWVFDSVLSLLSGKEATLTKPLINSAMSRQTYSSQKVRETIGFEFKPIPGIIAQICAQYLSVKSKTKASV